DRRDPRVAAEAPVELAVADVDREDPAHAAAEEAVGEAAGRSTDVESDGAADVEAERLERALELFAAPARESRRTRLETDVRVERDPLRRLGRAPTPDEDLAGEDHPLRPLPRVDDPASDEQAIEALLGRGFSSARGRHAGSETSERAAK